MKILNRLGSQIETNLIILYNLAYLFCICLTIVINPCERLTLTRFAMQALKMQRYYQKYGTDIYLHTFNFV